MSETVIDEKEMEAARLLAARYQFQFVDLRDSRPDAELLRTIPLELMLHYEFLPLEGNDRQLVMVVADPTNLARLDELEAKLDQTVGGASGGAQPGARFPEEDRTFPARSG